MPDQTDFIDMSNRNEAIAARFKKLWDDLVSARKDRGWPNGSFTPPTADGKTFITNESMNTLRDLATYNGVGPRYVNNFPAFDAHDGSEIRGNFLNEIQLVINDTKNGVGCNQGCMYVCIGCTNLCSGSSCTNTCGVAACTVNCGSGCSGNACSANCSSGCSRSCDNTCGSGCGGDTCSSSCSGSCDNTCNSGCTGTCSACTNACSSACSGECSSGCTNGCASSCSKTCQTTCDGSCASTNTGNTWSEGDTRKDSYTRIAVGNETPGSGKINSNDKTI